MRKLLGLARDELFAPSSERMVDPGQLGIFNEAEAVVLVSSEQELVEPNEESLKVKVKKRRGKNMTNLAELPVEEVRLELSEVEKHCGHCQCALHEIGEEVLSSKLEVVPARFYVRRTVQVRYGCRHCADHELTRPPVVVPAPKQSFGGMASASVVAHVVMQKYGLCVPLYRQEQFFPDGVSTCLARPWPTGWFRPENT